MQVLGFLAIIFGPIMEWIYRFIPNYGWALIVFTLLVNLVLLPLRIKQQKSTARMSAKRPLGRATMTIGTVLSIVTGVTADTSDGLPAISGAMNSTLKLAITTV